MNIAATTILRNLKGEFVVVVETQICFFFLSLLLLFLTIFAGYVLLYYFLIRFFLIKDKNVGALNGVFIYVFYT